MPFPGTRSRHLAAPRCQTTDSTLHALSDAHLADERTEATCWQISLDLFKLSAHNQTSSRFKSAQIGKSEGLKQAMASLRKANSGSFKVGNPGGPGRPVGARSKLNELAVALLHEDFAQHGAEVIERVRKNKPEVYLASVVSLLPKRTEKFESPLVDISTMNSRNLPNTCAPSAPRPSNASSNCNRMPNCRLRSRPTNSQLSLSPRV